jgi:hypothetical protein
MARRVAAATAHTWHTRRTPDVMRAGAIFRTRPSGKCLCGARRPDNLARRAIPRAQRPRPTAQDFARDRTLSAALHTSWSLPPQSSAILRREGSCERRSCSAYIRKLIDTENLSPRHRRGLEKEKK